MAFEHKPTADYSMPAAADLSANQYRFAVCNSSGQAALSGAGAATIGVIQNNDANAVNAAVALQCVGVSKVVAGAAVTAGAEVASDATGRAVTAATTNRVNGIALSTSANAGEIISVKLGAGGGQLN